MSENKVVTRFAPSPTGFMHVGGVRTALYAWLWAKKNGGQFILRIEDTDKVREVGGSIEHIQKSLKWLGLNWDQGPDVGGLSAYIQKFLKWFGLNRSYIQSERLKLYKKYAKILIEKGFAYADPYTEEEIEKWRLKAETENKPFLYRDHRPENPPKWDGTMPLRFKTGELKRTVWNDVVWGELSAGPEALDDFILIKSDGYPTYNFAHIIDDIEMGVTHVMRGQEFISSTPKFLSLYEALGVTPPLFATTPPIMGPDGKKKLSKRDGAKDILEYKREGYLPEAMINYLAFLGFNPGGEKEVYTPEELISVFDLNKIQRSGAQWNDIKLNWFNKEHIKQLIPEKYLEIGMNWVPKEYILKNGVEKTKRDLMLIRDNIVKFSDIINIFKNKKTINVIKILNNFSTKIDSFSKLSSEEKYSYLVKNNNENQEFTFTEDSFSKLSSEDEFSYLFSDPSYLFEMLIWKDLKNSPDKFLKTLEYLEKVFNLLGSVDEKDWTYESLKNVVWNYAGEEGRGNVLWPTRVALSGKEKSPDPFKLAETLGKATTQKRISKVIELLRKLIGTVNNTSNTNTKTVIN
ncbi:glutamate--tRNA ligase [Candidatus Nomurabacteria bacterium RIFOXYB1_FULL_39_16]|uniref:Glutamate--tRNA ligase n=2 Tax=Candidatus Nomuraibacteriota TaxID=1752729 RepID=A0A0G0QRY0_9BACT|nr:MAG: Glutamate-tRNA ligase [Candidatus Nomurabacteria bacterium GW2011_GWF2_40_12]OGJ09786.1 MAG: glutamate--tRNA ligase [Candidatus Nomurabacteria bacterium RIFOXYB1_FULL_39_16]OGJ15287.1 MAG: glutamate--tRNA ligase [Candidatus Nomurabacteria bacterium RIFOXYD1_FULL_39_12]